MPFAPSFYYHDRPVDEEADSTVSEESTPLDDVPTAIELTPMVKNRMPVFSSYIQPGMATPAYNTIQPARPETPTVPETIVTAVAAPTPAPKATSKPAATKEPSQEPPSHYSLPVEKDEYQPPKEYKYKESVYMGFKNDVTLVHGRGSQHSAEKHVSFEAKPEKPKEAAKPEKVKETAKQPTSRLVKSIKISEPPMAQPKAYQEYSAVEGDAFRPVQVAASEYHFGQLNDLVSCIDIKQ